MTTMDRRFPRIARLGWVGCSEGASPATLWRAIVVVFGVFAYCTGCQLDPVGRNVVYQGRTDLGTVVSIETWRWGTHEDKPQKNDEMPTFVIAQPDGSMITLRSAGFQSPADYEVIVTEPGGQECNLSLMRVYSAPACPDASVYKGTMLPSSAAAASRSTRASSRPGGP